MFTRCLVCQSPFPENEVLEHFPRGERVAFDAARGRLWAVCRSCRRWTPAPMEERWEALEELERLTRDRARLLSQTDNISLFRSGPLEIIKVGRANLTEEAWWRYGRELKARREKFNKVTLAGTVAAGAVMVGGWATGGASFIGMWFLWGNAPQVFTDGARWLRFGSTAWRGRGRCGRCGFVFRSLRFRDRGSLYLLPGQRSGEAGLSYRCPSCGHLRGGGLQLGGTDAERTLRRVLAYEHFDGASERRVRNATRLILEAGSPEDLTRILVKDGRRLGDIQRTGAIALEIAANEQAEQRLLELELAELELQWREEEELATIVDDELTPMPLLESLRLKVTGRT